MGNNDVGTYLNIQPILYRRNTLEMSGHKLKLGTNFDRMFYGHMIRYDASLLT